MVQGLLGRICELFNIEPGYWDISGTWHQAEDDARRAALSAMGVSVESEADLERSLHGFLADQSQQMLKPVHVVQAGDIAVELILQIPLGIRPSPLTCTIEFEDCSQSVQTIAHDQCRILDQYSDGEREFSRIGVMVRTVVPEGYHRLFLSWHDEGVEKFAETLLISSPDSCYLPPEISRGRRYVGLSLQLYSLRSQSNWGIGDLSDLKTLIESLKGKGLDFVGLNPLHAVPTCDGQAYSPYSPVSRLATNFLYLGIEEIPDFNESSEAFDFAKQPEVALELEKLRTSELVDYGRVAALKLQVLKLLFSSFVEKHLDHGSVRAAAFRQFVVERGDNLQKYAIYQALREHFVSQDSALWGWPVWPESFRDPHGESVREFVEKNYRSVEFYCYLEWLACLQLESVKKTLVDNGFEVGLYLDIALGASVNSSDVWANQSLFADGASIGAPPDAINEFGQEWGLPACLPREMQKSGYRLFIDSLRYVMQHARMVRIDHVMSLMRLFWIPQGFDGRQGVYVKYPLDELVGIVVLESQRNRCVVIGEDLGTVPDEVRNAMRRYSLLSYKLFVFERSQDGSYLPPESYNPQALVTASTHDLPTICGYWRGEEIKLRNALGLYGDGEIYQQELEGRSRDRELMTGALRGYGLNTLQSFIDAPRDTEAEELVQAITRFLSHTPCYFQVIQLEDLLLAIDQVNFPGTTTQHPNWRRKLSLRLDQLRRSHCLAEISSVIKGSR